MTNKTRWGIIGAGSIARKFAEGLQALPEAELTAIGSRSQASADAFARDYPVAHRHASYEALAQDPDVDAVYIATPHPMHKDNTLLCLDHGKAVLCEKPFAMNLGEVDTMIEAARARKLFLMEAMWTQCFPAMLKMQELIQEGAIGDVSLVQANFCFRSGWNPEGRLLNSALGGGALLDVGVYNVAFAQKVFGTMPERIVAMADIGETQVDEKATAILGYAGGATAVLTAAVRTSTPHEAVVYGTDGSIKVPNLFWQPDRIIVNRAGKDEEMTFPRLGNGYSFEAEEVHRCIQEGRTESTIISPAFSRQVITILDRIRQEIGLTYPGEATS